MTLSDCNSHGPLVFVCDASPPRGAGLDAIYSLSEVRADYFAVAYNPGCAVRANSIIFASLVKKHIEREVIAIISPRDMNKLALQSLLLGSSMLGVHNLLVVQGALPQDKSRSWYSNVWDYSASGLIKSISEMNKGVDFRNLPLSSPTRFCIGSAIDIGKDFTKQCELMKEKLDAGAKFFITQPFFDISIPNAITTYWNSLFENTIEPSIYYGIYVLEKNSRTFGTVPLHIKRELEMGTPGFKLAIDQISKLHAQGIHKFYLIPPILKGGVKDYKSISLVINAYR